MPEAPRVGWSSPGGGTGTGEGGRGGRGPPGKARGRVKVGLTFSICFLSLPPVKQAFSVVAFRPF